MAHTSGYNMDTSARRALLQCRLDGFSARREASRWQSSSRAVQAVRVAPIFTSGYGTARATRPRLTLGSGLSGALLIRTHSGRITVPMPRAVLRRRVPSLVSPGNGATCQSTNLTLDWTSSAGGEGYDLLVTTATNCSGGTPYALPENSSTRRPVWSGERRTTGASAPRTSVARSATGPRVGALRRRRHSPRGSIFHLTVQRTFIP